MPQLFTSEVDSLPVIIFRNTSLHQFSAFVCENMAACDREVARLRAMDHIEVMVVQNAVVKRDE